MCFLFLWLLSTRAKLVSALRVLSRERIDRDILRDLVFNTDGLGYMAAVGGILCFLLALQSFRTKASNVYHLVIVALLSGFVILGGLIAF
jgi:hypothetical protein